MLLNHMAEISQRGARLDECQSLVEAFLRDANQSLGVWCDLANTDHDAGIAMPAIFDHCDVDVDDVAVAELSYCLRGCRGRSPRSPTCRSIWEAFVI